MNRSVLIALFFIVFNIQYCYSQQVTRNEAVAIAHTDQKCFLGGYYGLREADVQSGRHDNTIAAVEPASLSKSYRQHLDGKRLMN